MLVDTAVDDCRRHGNRAKERLQKFIGADQDQGNLEDSYQRQRSSRKDSINYRSVPVKIGFIVLQKPQVFLKEGFSFVER